MVEEKGAQLRPNSPQPERRRYKGIHDRSKEIVAVGRVAARNSFKLHRDGPGQLTKRKETSSTWHAGSHTAGDSQLRAQRISRHRRCSMTLNTSRSKGLGGAYPKRMRSWSRVCDRLLVIDADRVAAH
jgi:hypothetical protein